MDDEGAVGLEERFGEGAGVGVFGGIEEVGGDLGGVALIACGDLREADGFMGDPGLLGGIGEGFAFGASGLDRFSGVFGGLFQGGGGPLGDEAGAGFVAGLFVGLRADLLDTVEARDKPLVLSDRDGG